VSKKALLPWASSSEGKHIITPFTADEAFQIAELLERNGVAFYRRAAANAGDQKCRRLLFDLAQMEDEHAQAFAEMYEQFTGKPLDIEEIGRNGPNLHTIADRCVFGIITNPGDVLSGEADIADILSAAIKTEKNAVVFYLWIKQSVDGIRDISQIDRIVREEMRHVTDISAQLASLGDGVRGR